MAMPPILRTATPSIPRTTKVSRISPKTTTTSIRRAVSLTAYFWASSRATTRTVSTRLGPAVPTAMMPNSTNL
ncbi:unnamed protein product [Pylaiella littoralis]